MLRNSSLFEAIAAYYTSVSVTVQCCWSSGCCYSHVCVSLFSWRRDDDILSTLLNNISNVVGSVHDSTWYYSIHFESGLVIHQFTTSSGSSCRQSWRCSDDTPRTFLSYVCTVFQLQIEKGWDCLECEVALPTLSTWIQILAPIDLLVILGCSSRRCRGDIQGTLLNNNCSVVCSEIGTVMIDFGTAFLLLFSPESRFLASSILPLQ